MPSSAIITVSRMMEFLPESLQVQVEEHLRDYIEDLLDEMKWEQSFRETQGQLEAAARDAKREIAEGKSEPMDFSKL
jgi:hypothetical protein